MINNIKIDKKTIIRWFNMVAWDLHNFNEDIAKHLYGDVLDIGAGEKQTIFNKKITKYVRLDNDKIFKETSGNVLQDNLDVCGDAHNLPFKNNSFDCTVMLQVLEHLNEPQTAIKEAHRVLKHNGIFAITVPFMVKEHSIPHDYYRYTQYGLRYLLEKNGFKVLKIKNGGGLWKVIGAKISGYLYSEILGLGYAGEDNKGIKKKKILIPLIAPLIAITVIFFRFLDKIHTTSKDTLHYYVLCKKI